ncbi:spore germination protein GerPE [Priestia abyssalis]|uniref:spore germination protein GerPE n=1 Tax=Priestia abyssalis TaxID=1221450 RepID=UPI0009955571|nr:spore germination protein GerPE [Priestia abyssalis]
MVKRMSCVNHINITSMDLSSILQIGDSCHIIAKAKVLAVQREHPFFFAQEGRFEDYLTFTEELPVQPLEFINMRTVHEVPAIKINHIDILGVSTSSLAHIGSTETFSAESRVLHIRQLSGDRRPASPNN